MDQQIGRDDSLDEYIESIVETFAKVRRVLTEDGTVWLNVGDSYTSGNRGYRAPDRKRPDGVQASRMVTLTDLRERIRAETWRFRDISWKSTAALYGVGSRLDDRPESLFLLRGVDSAELVATGMALPGDTATDDALADDALAGIFGIDLDLDPGDAPPPKASAKPRKPARRRAVPAPERQAPPAAKAREVAASMGNARRAASSGTRKARASPAASAPDPGAAPGPRG